MSAPRQKIAAAVNLIGPAVADPDREFAFSDEDFKTLSKLAYEQAGIVLAEASLRLQLRDPPDLVLAVASRHPPGSLEMISGGYA